MSPRVLLVEDDPNARAGVAEILAAEGWEPVAVAGAAAARAAAAGGRVDVALVDVRLSDGDGIDLAVEIKGGDPDLPVVVMTAYASVRAAVEAMRRGVDGYLTKPLDFDEVRLALRRAVETRGLREENRRLRAAVGARWSFADVVGEAPAWRRAVAAARAAAGSDSAVLLRGESGTGKELVAHAIHLASPRAGGPFVAINCAAIPADLLESELFGHEAGAFTGAVRRRGGKVGAADGGTLLLDEIGDMPPALQAKILRVIESKEYVPLGAIRPLRSDFRLVSSTHRDLAAMVRDGAFREDLYYRLHVIEIRLPPLRERREDVPLLLDRFLRRLAAARGAAVPAVSAEAIEVLLRHPWPGNVREIEHFAERAFLAARGGPITAETAEETLLPPAAEAAAPAGALSEAVADLERRMIESALERHGGSRTRAAMDLGISLRSLQYKLKGYGIG